MGQQPIRMPHGGAGGAGGVGDAEVGSALWGYSRCLLRPWAWAGCGGWGSCGVTGIAIEGGGGLWGGGVVKR